MFTGTRFVLLAPLLVPSYVLALSGLRQTKEGGSGLFPFLVDVFGAYCLDVGVSVFYEFAYFLSAVSYFTDEIV